MCGLVKSDTALNGRRDIGALQCDNIENQYRVHKAKTQAPRNVAVMYEKCSKIQIVGSLQFSKFTPNFSSMNNDFKS